MSDLASLAPLITAGAGGLAAIYATWRGVTTDRKSAEAAAQATRNQDRAVDREHFESVAARLEEMLEHVVEERDAYKADCERLRARIDELIARGPGFERRGKS